MQRGHFCCILGAVSRQPPPANPFSKPLSLVPTFRAGVLFEIDSYSLLDAKIASQNRSDHGGRKRACNRSAGEIAGFFASAAAKNNRLPLAIFGMPSKSQEARSDHGRKSPQPRDFTAAATTGHYVTAFSSFSELRGGPLEAS